LPVFRSFMKGERKMSLEIVSEEREFKRLLVGEIGMAIIQASVNCRDAVKQLIKVPTEKERQKREIFIFYEFIYFYMHLTLRQAFGNLTKERLQKLQGFLGPMISSVAIDSYFAHWPEDLKQKMTGEFYEKLNDAETEYAECAQFDTLVAGEERIKEIFQALFFKLSLNVANLAGNEEADLTLLIPVTEVAFNEWSKMHLGKLISEIKKAG
jgi:hypothetical protein